MVSKFIKRGTNKKKVWEHGNIGQFCKGTRTPFGRPSPSTENSIIFIPGYCYSWHYKKVWGINLTWDKPKTD